MQNRFIGIAFLLVVATILTYGRAWNHEFVAWEGNENILDDPYLTKGNSHFAL